MAICKPQPVYGIKISEDHYFVRIRPNNQMQGTLIEREAFNYTSKWQADKAIEQLQKIRPDIIYTVVPINS